MPVTFVCAHCAVHRESETGLGPKSDTPPGHPAAKMQSPAIKALSDYELTIILASAYSPPCSLTTPSQLLFECLPNGLKNHLLSI